MTSANIGLLVLGAGIFAFGFYWMITDAALWMPLWLAVEFLGLLAMVVALS